MKIAGMLLGVVVLAGCSSAPPLASVPNPPPAPGGPKWDEIDKSTERTKARATASKGTLTVADNLEAGYFAMTDEEYAAALSTARDEVKKANPAIKEADLEKEAVRRADAARAKHEHAFSVRGSRTYEWKSP